MTRLEIDVDISESADLIGALEILETYCRLESNKKRVRDLKKKTSV
jgi:hypothetical protein